MQYMVATKLLMKTYPLGDRKTTKKCQRLIKFKPKKKQKDINPIFNDILEHLQAKFGTRVLIKDKGKSGKLKLNITVARFRKNY